MQPLLKRLNLPVLGELSQQDQEALVTSQRTWSQRTLLTNIINRAKTYKRKPLAPVEYHTKHDKVHLWRLTGDTEFDTVGTIKSTEELRKQGFKVPALPKK